MWGLNIKFLDNHKSEFLAFLQQHPQEKQPFYLTEEERRTLIAEGLPVPTGLPLTKVYTVRPKRFSMFLTYYQLQCYFFVLTTF